jgi:hypothetical protein
VRIKVNIYSEASTSSFTYILLLFMTYKLLGVFFT